MRWKDEVDEGAVAVDRAWLSEINVEIRTLGVTNLSIANRQASLVSFFVANSSYELWNTSL